MLTAQSDVGQLVRVAMKHPRDAFVSQHAIDRQWQAPVVPKLWTELMLREWLRACSGAGQLVALRICELDSFFRLVRRDRRAAKMMHSMKLICAVKRSPRSMELVLSTEWIRRGVPGGADAFPVVLTRPVKQ